MAPELKIDRAGVREAKVGGALSLPLVLRNGARVGRPLFLKGLWTREAGGEWQPVEVSWERLEPGQSAPLYVRAAAFDQAGVHGLEIMLALATRWRWREEVTSFHSALSLTVEGDAGLTVQQNISYAADAPQTGATIYAPIKVTSEGADRPRAAGEARPLILTRAERLEREFGLVGYGDGTTVSRAVRLCWRGFDEGHAPADGPLVAPGGLMSLGRARARIQGGTGDVRLVASTRDGKLDEPASLGISRRHFELCVENARLVLRVESDRGAWINGQHVPRGSSTPLRDGDRFSPIAKDRGRIAVTASFETHHGVVETITFSRS